MGVRLLMYQNVDVDWKWFRFGLGISVIFKPGDEGSVTLELGWLKVLWYVDFERYED